MSSYSPRHAVKGSGRMRIFSGSFWRKAGLRALYSGLAAVVPLGMQIAAGEVGGGFLFGMVGLTVLLSLATSLAGLPEYEGNSASPVAAVFYRAVRTLGQTLVAAVGTASVLQDVDWRQAAVAVGGAVLVTVLRAALDELPEQAKPEVSEQ